MTRRWNRRPPTPLLDACRDQAAKIDRDRRRVEIMRTRARLMARSRTSDPEASRRAAAAIEGSGVAMTQRILCLAEVFRHPGETAAEIAHAIDVERHMPSRRLPELRDAGLVENRETRICTVQGRTSLTWWPREQAR